MSERIRKGILGGISGVVAAVSMDFLKSSGYLGGSSITIRAVLAGVIGFLVFMGLNALSGRGKEGTKQD